MVDISDDMHEMAMNCYGYGRWEAPYWFIGLEEGMGPHENNDLSHRLSAWQKLGKLDLNDCREFHREIKEKRWHFIKSVNLQSTWRPLMLLLFAFKGNLPDEKALQQEAMRNYQRDRWGSSDKKQGEICVIELSGLAASNLNELRDRESYRTDRIKMIRSKIADYKPKLVVMYGLSQRASWREIAGRPFPEASHFLIHKPTILAMAPHPASHQAEGNLYWINLGRELRKQADDAGI